ncbi:MAG: carotenoid biosynthesis protein [Thermonemataceae bacterium]|nr:carotenoid biosynthesis protein [Thermonemataceae bacterium]
MLRFFSEKNTNYLLLAMHLAGFLGLLIPFTRDFFKILVPFNLLSNFALLIYFHKEKKTIFWVLLVWIMLVGFWVEYIGVETGFIFGNYWYKTTLGYKFLGIPLMIAINWFIVIYSSSAVVAPTSLLKWQKAILASFLAVFLDYWIEPVAIRLDFWDWQGGVVPLQNYLGWFVTALFLQIPFQYSSFEKKNKVASMLYFYELVFFMLLAIFLA